jgi:hypothetical protein
MILSQEEFEDYIADNYPDVTENMKSTGRIIDYCPYCKANMGMNVFRRKFVTKTKHHPAKGAIEEPDFNSPFMIVFSCPDCQAQRRWIAYEIEGRLYKIMSIPSDNIAEIDELPAEPTSLRKAYNEAIRAYNANCPMAAAAMIRRALQVITREILGAPPSQLGNELRWLQGKKNRLDIILSSDFHDNAYIIKEIGNQAAHPDQDPDLLSFTDDDAINLNALFIDIATELFIIPQVSKKAKDEMMIRRKLKR